MPSQVKGPENRLIKPIKPAFVNTQRLARVYDVRSPTSFGKQEVLGSIPGISLEKKNIGQSAFSISAV
jgi:hypothetical protein